jgi:murein DD-endopeptidase MepM/ murein hydrolase activator NlpD
MVLKKPILLYILLSFLLGGCVKPVKPFEEAWGAPRETITPTSVNQPAQAVVMPDMVVRHVGDPIQTPTADAPHLLPTPRADAEEYIVQAGDALGRIAERYGVTIDMLVEANGIVNADLLEVGQVLAIPAPVPAAPGSSVKVIPDSELVYGPSSANFDIFEFVKSHGGYLTEYREEIDGKRMGGPAIVQRVAQEFSVNPRLLLAVLEYQSGWLTNASPPEKTLDYPMGVPESWRKGLYQQLAWAANVLNRGYYLWKVNGVGSWVLADGSVVAIDPTINAGTAAVQGLFATLYDRSGWDQAVSESGLHKTFFEQFGYPFDYAVEPLLPTALIQPEMQLPIEPGQVWAFTGGPHGGWGSGSAWAALDFAPPGEALGCVQSDAWVVAVADGPIVRSGGGAVVQDLDGDGKEQTGWTVLYMHIETRDRVSDDTYLRAGERIGHPSCEGGFSSGTHLHLARRYNGEWVPADQQTPFILDGWTSQGAGIEYDGYLVRDGKTIEAWEGYYPENQIQR